MPADREPSRFAAGTNAERRAIEIPTVTIAFAAAASRDGSRSVRLRVIAFWQMLDRVARANVSRSISGCWRGHAESALALQGLACGEFLLTILTEAVSCRTIRR